jgi:hypothetical protein
VSGGTLAGGTGGTIAGGTIASPAGGTIASPAGVRASERGVSLTQQLSTARKRLNQQQLWLQQRSHTRRTRTTKIGGDSAVAHGNTDSAAARGADTERRGWSLERHYNGHRRIEAASASVDGKAVLETGRYQFSREHGHSNGGRALDFVSSSNDISNSNGNTSSWREMTTPDLLHTRTFSGSGGAGGHTEWPTVESEAPSAPPAAAPRLPMPAAVTPSLSQGGGTRRWDRSRPSPGAQNQMMARGSGSGAREAPGRGTFWWLPPST